MYNSPIDWCPACRQWVALDNGCPSAEPGRQCRVAAARRQALAPRPRPPAPPVVPFEVLPGVPM